MALVLTLVITETNEGNHELVQPSNVISRSWFAGENQQVSFQTKENNVGNRTGKLHAVDAFYRTTDL